MESWKQDEKMKRLMLSKFLTDMGKGRQFQFLLNGAAVSILWSQYFSFSQFMVNYLVHTYLRLNEKRWKILKECSDHNNSILIRCIVRGARYANSTGVLMMAVIITENWILSLPCFSVLLLSCTSFSSHLIWICLISAISQSRFKNLHVSATNPVRKSESRTGSALFHSTHSFHRHTCNLTLIIWVQHLLEVISCEEELFDSPNLQWEGSVLQNDPTPCFRFFLCKTCVHT